MKIGDHIFAGNYLITAIQNKIRKSLKKWNKNIIYVFIID